MPFFATSSEKMITLQVERFTPFAEYAFIIFIALSIEVVVIVSKMGFESFDEESLEKEETSINSNVTLIILGFSAASISIPTT